MFDDTGFPSPGMDYPAPGDYCDTVDETFCNNKLISARHFNDDITLHPDEVDSPLGINGHGTHVAGSAVGNYVEGADLGDGVLENVSGVAPGAWLMVCKGLWWNGTTGSGGSGDLIACVDSMVADGADVINNSYGGGGGGDPRSDAFGEVFENAEAAGVVAVAAAGNDGPGARTIGCPGCQPSVLTVANSTHGRIHALSVDVDFPPAVQSTLPLSGLGCLEGTGVPFTGTVGPDPIVYAGDVDAANFEGCDPFPAMSMDGAIALISRGSCAFATKVAEAEAAGAVATIVFNNLPGTPIVMGGLNAGETISSCMLSNDQGILVRDHVQANPGAPGTINFPQSRVTNENWEDFIASGSSRGPNGWADILKPEIAAPGTNIFSAWSPDAPGSPGPSDFTIISGTSMASPHIAGAAALVMQQNPGWEPWQVKSALTSTTVQDLVKEDGMTPADPFDFGAGRVDLDRAKDAGLTFDQVSIADGSCVVECGFERMVRNELALPATWNAFVELDGDMMDPQAIVESGIQIEVEPSSLLLDPGENAFFSVYVDTSLAEQGEWHFARIRWVYSGPPTGAVVPDAVMPMAIFAAASRSI
jgi:subtilisin family serine protease